MSDTSLTILKLIPESVDDIAENFVEESFNKISFFWEKGDYHSVIQQSEKLFAMGVIDIRISVYYLYSRWITPPSDPLDTIIESLNFVLKKAWDAEPADSYTSRINNVKTIHTSLVLFFSRIKKRLQRHHYQNIELQPISPDIRIHIDSLSSFCRKQLADSDLVDIIQSLQPFFTIAHAEIDIDTDLAQEQSNSVNSSVISIDQNRDIPTQDIESLQDQSVPGNPLPQQFPSIISPALRLLLDKITLFDSLIQNGQLYNAAIVFDDIETELNSFNPLHYLPSLFSSYAGQVMHHITTLNQIRHQSDPAYWQACKNLYAANIEQFSKTELDGSTQGNTTDWPEQSTSFDDNFQ